MDSINNREPRSRIWDMVLLSARNETRMFSQGNRVSGQFTILHAICLPHTHISPCSRDAFREMLDSVKPGFAECIQVLKDNMKLDPYFTEFYNWAKEHNVPIVVVSSGMVPIISGLFEVLLGHTPDPKHLTIVANTVESRDGKDINTPGGWKIKYHDDRY
jgi:2-hydroxy-3-keto-5-methylthiopentenyl-1-phosphate phosphatase